MRSKYIDGLYLLTNPIGVSTQIKVISGLVFVVNGFSGGATGKTLDYFIRDGFTVVYLGSYSEEV